MRCAIDDTIEYVKHLAQQMAGCKAEYIILVILMRLGIPTNHDGFEYLKISVLMRYENPMRTMVNDMYPELRNRYGKHVTDDQIESSIRTAIQRGWEQIGLPVWRIFLPTILTGQDKKPSNAEFVYELARIIELWCGCAEAYARQGNREEVGNYGKR